MGVLSFKKLVAALSFAFIVGSAWASDGYLAQIGPSPLTFQEPPMWLDPALVLPPLKMSDPIPTTNTVAVSHSNTNLVSDVETLSPTPGSTEITVSSMPGHLPNSTPEISSAPNDQNPERVTPEVLMRYFNKRGHEVLVSPPVQFVPPPPSPGSSATYTSE